MLLAALHKLISQQYILAQLKIMQFDILLLLGTTPGLNSTLCFIKTLIYSVAFMLYTNAFNLVNLPTKM